MSDDDVTLHRNWYTKNITLHADYAEESKSRCMLLFIVEHPPKKATRHYSNYKITLNTKVLQIQRCF